MQIVKNSVYCYYNEDTYYSNVTVQKLIVVIKPYR